MNETLAIVFAVPILSMALLASLGLIEEMRTWKRQLCSAGSRIYLSETQSPSIVVLSYCLFLDSVLVLAIIYGLWKLGR